MKKNTKFLHNYRFRRKIKNEENIWINPDLTRTKRESTFEKEDKKEKQRTH